MTPTTTFGPAAGAAAASTPWWVAPAVIAGVIAAAVAIVVLLVNGRRARVDRQRLLFAAAFGDIAGYQEYVYIVRRRRHDQPEAERVRISNDLSEVQRKLNQHSAALKVEAPRVAEAFDELLRMTRLVAGAAIREGWNSPPITKDINIHVDIRLTAITPYEDLLLTEVRDHLSAVPGTVRRWHRSALAAARGHLARRHNPGQPVVDDNADNELGGTERPRDDWAS
jgi:hypothetical protein